jgi:DNA-binding HxlR family transcriptional regulator
VRRFRELERAIPGISQRMLTLTTKRLCRDGWWTGSPSTDATVPEGIG